MLLLFFRGKPKPLTAPIQAKQSRRAELLIYFFLTKDKQKVEQPIFEITVKA